MGAGIKLSERSPMLLPSPVRDVMKAIANAVGRGSEADFTVFLDLMLRVTVSVEFTLAAAMIVLPRISRSIAIPLLAMFVLILGVVVARGEASCGCFGSKGPSPWIVLICDLVLLSLVLIFPALPGRFTKESIGGCIALSAMGVAVAFGVPQRIGMQHLPQIDHPMQAQPATTHGDEVAKPGDGAQSLSAIAATQQGTVATTTITLHAAATSAWPTAPTTLQPYYLPQFEQWVGTRLRDQPIAALITPAIPADLEKGRWIVMFFREDCEHCHAVLDRFFTPKVPMNTLLIAVPDADPAASLPNPCSECNIRTLPKGPDWVIGTPVLLSIQDGVVKAMLGGTAPEDAKMVEKLLRFE